MTTQAEPLIGDTGSFKVSTAESRSGIRVGYALGCSGTRQAG